MTALERITELRNELHRHNYNYYVRHNPEISDFEFDKLLKELQDLEQKHPEYFDPTSPTQRVGSDLDAGFVQEKHESKFTTFLPDNPTCWIPSSIY